MGLVEYICFYFLIIAIFKPEFGQSSIDLLNILLKIIYEEKRESYLFLVF